MRVTLDTLTLDGRRIVSRASVQKVIVSAGPPLVRLVRGAFLRDVDVLTENGAAAKVLVAALGFGAT